MLLFVEWWWWCFEHNVLMFKCARIKVLNGVVCGAADIISAIEFDHSGDYLATGDHGGRVVLFERTMLSKSEAHEAEGMDQRSVRPSHPYEYVYLTEFQSHDPEFDYLKSLEIEEKINQVRWLKKWGSGASCHTLLTTNDKTVKLWKVYEKKVVMLDEPNIMGGSNGMNRSPQSDVEGSTVRKMDTSPMSPSRGNRSSGVQGIKFPSVLATKYEISSKCRKTYSAAHAYNINSIALCADEEMFLSADDLRINLWHLDRPDLSFTVVDIKPESMEELSEVITCADFHPYASHIFAYGSSKGYVRIADMRASALCDQHAKLFDGTEKDPEAMNFFSEIISNINDVKFIGSDGNLLLSRDYMTLKVWDIRYEAEPLYVHPVHDSVRQKLARLYESDAIFDRFDCCASGDGSMLATGTYSNYFRVTPIEPSAESILLESSRDPMQKRMSQPSKFPNRIVGFGRTIPRSSSKNSLSRRNSFKPEPAITDFNCKIQHMAWHPCAPIIATAAQNSLYIYYGRNFR